MALGEINKKDFTSIPGIVTGFVEYYDFIIFCRKDQVSIKLDKDGILTEIHPKCTKPEIYEIDLWPRKN